MSESAAAGTGQPVRGRPLMPESYGLAKDEAGLLEWDAVSAQIEASRNFWVVTAGPSGNPHAMPVWGVWLDGAFVFSTGGTSRKGRNLAADSRLVVHLESGDDVVILRGRVAAKVTPELLARADAAYADKYRDPGTGDGYHLPATANGEDGVYLLRPRTVLAWREHDFPTSATRWRFPAV